MTLKEDCRNNKLTLIAMNKFVQESAAALGLSLAGPLATICEHAQVNRTQVYERKKQIENALTETALASPGHPVCRPATDPATTWEERGLRLREQVLRYRLSHPGALVVHGEGYTNYSDGFIRFILDLRDVWEGTLERFCEFVEIPCQDIQMLEQKRSGAAVWAAPTPDIFLGLKPGK